MKHILIIKFILLSATLSAQGILNNQSLIEMKKAGLSENIIKSKIAMEESNFDVSTDAILELKKEGFSEDIIILMIEKEDSNINYYYLSYLLFCILLFILSYQIYSILWG